MGSEPLDKGHSHDRHGQPAKMKVEVFPVDGKIASATVVFTHGQGGSSTVKVESTKTQPGVQVRSDVEKVENKGPAQVWISDN